MPEERPYRKNVGIVVFNSRGQVLAGDRIQYPGMFQFPQGGIDEGEEPLEAARRELMEEVGLKMEGPSQFEIVNWLKYEFPADIPYHLKQFRGQMQKWFFFYWDGDASTLQLDLHNREFATVKWMDFGEVVHAIVNFKKDVYNAVFDTGRVFIKQFIAPIKQAH